MKRRRRPGKAPFGYIAIAVGVLIVVFMMMPSGFWWFLTGVALIALGLFAVSRC